MSISKSRFNILLQKWNNHQLDKVEMVELIRFLQQTDQEVELSKVLKELYDDIHDEAFFSTKEKQQIINLALGKTKRKFNIKSFSIAASILIGIVSISFLMHKKNNPKKLVVKNEKQDIAAPTTIKATLTLGNGKIIALDSIKEGENAQHDEINILKNSNGTLTCKSQNNQLTYNTLTVPRGSRPQQLILTDGSKVWVNVASSITFPSAFINNERKVIVNGEAYFEVTHNPQKPFIVSHNHTTIEVLGTHFDFNGYDDEKATKVTLLEGRVKVNNTLTLNPGEQAIVGNNQTELKKGVDLDKVMGWKNNEFVFDNDDIETIMRQLSKWYNIDIVYKNAVPKGHFSGVVDKNNNLSQVLQILEVGGIHFKINGNTLSIL